MLADLQMLLQTHNHLQATGKDASWIAFQVNLTQTYCLRTALFLSLHIGWNEFPAYKPSAWQN